MAGGRQFEDYLAGRRFARPSPDLAERIILQARMTTQRPGLLAVLAAQIGEFMLPSPAVSLTAALALGLMIGFSLPLQTEVNGYMTIMQTYIDDEGGIP